MLLEIRHLTEYRYAAPVRESVMELWVQPQKSVRQRLISFDVELDPPAQLFSYVDTFGNAVYHFDVPQPHEALTIRSRALVETEAPDELPEVLDRGEWERLKSHFVQGECFDFLRPHGLVTGTPALKAFEAAHELDEVRRADPLTAMKTLCQVIYEAFDYEQGVTRADSPIDETLLEGRGVCQDFAHIMIAICRSWGVPARYVSGYLFTNREGGHRSDPDATHAWVEVFLPSLRWVGFDPTNNVLAGESHVTVAVGRDYGDVPPSRGVYKGDTESELAVGVSVRQTRSAQTEPEFLKVGQAAFAGVARRRATAAALEQQLQQQQQQQQQ
jgi:transglutaminase-like putative cysteine protease